jgi:hypothetical protein
VGDGVDDDVSDHGVRHGFWQLWSWKFDGQEDGGNAEDESRIADKPVSPVEDPPKRNR